MEDKLCEGIIYDGASIDQSLAGFDFCLTLFHKPHERMNYREWLARTRKKPRRKDGGLVIRVLVREVGERIWTDLGHFGGEDRLHYGWFNPRQLIAFFMWLDSWCQEAQFCAPIPGSSCHREAPSLPEG